MSRVRHRVGVRVRDHFQDWVFWQGGGGATHSVKCVGGCTYRLGCEAVRRTELRRATCCHTFGQESEMFLLFAAATMCESGR